LLKIFLIPFGGRTWCALCPIPGPGEWLQRRGILTPPRGKPFTLGKKWPRRLDNVWLQNVGLLAVTAFSPLILTQPRTTGFVLLAFLLLPVALSLVFERRVFCRYICPVGGFIGLYATVSPLELRVKDAETCQAHREKECYLGSSDGYGCPWLVKPWRLTSNSHCGLCTECLKTCPKDNVAIRLRPWGRDLATVGLRQPGRAVMAIIMLTGAIFYSAVFLGPWSWLKDWAAATSFPGRASYTVAFVTLNLVVVPAVALAAAAASRRLGHISGASLKEYAVHLSAALVPSGLSLWIAFSLSFLLANGSYLLNVLSDPFGWGWDLLGTTSMPWTPFGLGLLPYLQAIVVTAGLACSVIVAQRAVERHGVRGGRAIVALLPVVLFLLLVAVAFLWIYVG
jgi:hypothetical protein